MKYQVTIERARPRDQQVIIPGAASTFPIGECLREYESNTTRPCRHAGPAPVPD